MMQPFVAYDAAGRIKWLGAVQDIDFDKQSAPGLTFAADDGSAHPATHYVIGGITTARPACPVSASVAGRTINLAGVPMGAQIAVSGESDYDLANDDPGGEVALVLPDAGAYRVIVDCFPAQDFAQDFAL